MKSKRENMKEFMDGFIKPIIKKYGFYLGGSIILLGILIQNLKQSPILHNSKLMKVSLS